MRRLYARNTITTIDGLPIVSNRDDTADFLRIITLSFDLLREHDPRRHRRIVSSADWIVDYPLPNGAGTGRFIRSNSAIEMDFEFPADFGDDLRHAAYYAALLVHEGTHGLLLKRGFDYTKESRVQTERICVAEENRFLSRMNGVREGLGDSLQVEFDASPWEKYWAMGNWEIFKRHVKRIWAKDRTDGVATNRLPTAGRKLHDDSTDLEFGVRGQEAYDTLTLYEDNGIPVPGGIDITSANWSGLDDSPFGWRLRMRNGSGPDEVAWQLSCAVHPLSMESLESFLRQS